MSAVPFSEIPRRSLVSHRLVDRLDSLQAWQTFMRYHVFAVWDFMSLLKRLQREYTCTHLPWVPSPRADLARFVNEMVLEEETDLDQEGQPTSHFELYLRAMREAQADTQEIDRLLGALRTQMSWPDALVQANAPPVVSHFVSTTLHIATAGQAHEAAASFFWGREEILPDIFTRLVAKARPFDELQTLVYYFERHIALDGDSHGPMAKKLVEAALNQDPQKAREARAAAQLSLEARERLWTHVATCLGVGAS